MWLRAWGLDPDLLVARLARKRPVAFIGVAKIWREPRDRIARIAVLKLELPELESPAAACLLRESVDRGDRILPEAPAAHRVSGKLPAGGTGFAALAPRLVEFLAGCNIVELEVTGQDARFLEMEFLLAEIESPITENRLVDARRVLSDDERRGLEAFLRFYCVPTRENALDAGAATPARSTGVSRGVERFPTRGLRRPDIPGLDTLDLVAA